MRFSFRAWHKAHKEMVCFDNSKAAKDQHQSSAILRLMAGDDSGVLMQWTGMTDMHDKKIYEGDVVKFTLWWFDGNVAESELVGEIVYTPGCMSFSLKGIKNEEWLRHIGGDSNSVPDTQPFSEFNFEEADFEVIGNIYENTEVVDFAT